MIFATDTAQLIMGFLRGALRQKSRRGWSRYFGPPEALAGPRGRHKKIQDPEPVPGKGSGFQGIPY
eukprot:2251256-Pyramimonas_sp.AAC.1